MSQSWRRTVFRPLWSMTLLHFAPRFFIQSRGATHVMVAQLANGRFLYVPMVETGNEGEWYCVTAYFLDEQRARRIYEGGAP